MDLGFVVLACHEDFQELLRRVEVEDFLEVSLLVVEVVALYGYIVDFIENIDNFGGRYTQVPDDFWSAFLVVHQLVCDLVDNLLYILSDLQLRQQLLLLRVF